MHNRHIKHINTIKNRTSMHDMFSLPWISKTVKEQLQRSHLLYVQLDVPNTSSTLVLNFDYFNFVLTINLYSLVAFD